ncbi:hypothetical protein [Bosea sp. (in: a-proteobacteria)]|uniref:hypothetical protein n=1 Tax=Bosea sp. (in: a-proteobacteria) TaxID=1871050 RepID=UPI003561D145
MIVDQSLRDMVGHHFEYDFAVGNSAAEHGLSASVLAHTSFKDLALFGDVPVTPWFTQTFYSVDRSRSVQLLRPLLHKLPIGLRAPLMRVAAKVLGRLSVTRETKLTPTALPMPVFGAELRRYLDTQRFGRHDHVLIHTISMSELHSAMEALASDEEGPKLHVVLRRDADEPGIRSGAWGGAPGAFERLGVIPALARRMAFYTDSIGLAQQYKDLAPGFEFQILPVPYPVPANPPERRPRRSGPLRLTYVGDARVEKGYDRLPDLMRELGETLIDGRTARLIAQSNAAMSLEDHVIARARNTLKRYPIAQVELITRVLGVDEFTTLLSEADIVILPYDAGNYRNRSSGILVQAIAAGKPVVAPAGTWLSATAPAEACIHFDTPEQLGQAVAHAIQSFDKLSEAAIRSAPAWRAFHSGSNLVRILKRDRMAGEAA